LALAGVMVGVSARAGAAAMTARQQARALQVKANGLIFPSQTGA
jgi:hypothetical protein